LESGKNRHTDRASPARIAVCSTSPVEPSKRDDLLAADVGFLLASQPARCMIARAGGTDRAAVRVLSA